MRHTYCALIEKVNRLLILIARHAVYDLSLEHQVFFKARNMAFENACISRVQLQQPFSGPELTTFWLHLQFPSHNATLMHSR